MTIEINMQYTVKHVQDMFSEAYPFLKLVLYKSKPTAKGRAVVPARTRLIKLNLSGKNGLLEIGPSVITGQLEQQLQQRFGLWAQVFRRSGNIWLETTATDSWSLGRQNTEGHLSCSNATETTEPEMIDMDTE